jgi:hypothetical protein
MEFKYNPLIFMRLLESIPSLPAGEGRLWSGNTGGEHLTKYSRVDEEYNPLRRNYLYTITGNPVGDIPHDQYIEMLLNNTHEVIFVDRLDVANNSENASGLVAGAIAVRTRVVHPQLRRRNIASYILGKLQVLEAYGSGELTEMVFDTTQYGIEDWFLQKLMEVRQYGFPVIPRIG